MKLYLYNFSTVSYILTLFVASPSSFSLPSFICYDVSSEKRLKANTTGNGL